MDHDFVSATGHLAIIFIENAIFCTLKAYLIVN